MAEQIDVKQTLERLAAERAPTSIDFKVFALMAATAQSVAREDSVPLALFPDYCNKYAVPDDARNMSIDTTREYMGRLQEAELITLDQEKFRASDELVAHLLSRPENLGVDQDVNIMLFELSTFASMYLGEIRSQGN